MTAKKRAIIFFVLITSMACNEIEKQELGKIEYPTTSKCDSADTYFGRTVKDEYRWLEDDNSEQTGEWVKKQNELTFDYLQNIPFRAKLKDRIRSLMDYERITAPRKHGAYVYSYKNDGLQNQSVLYRKKEKGDETEVFLDPNTFSKDGTTSLAGTSFTKDGSLVAYSVSEGGSDWRKVIVMDTDSKTILEDTLTNVKFSGISWNKNEGFYYSSYDSPDKGSVLSGKTQHHKLFYHQLGTPQSEDQLIFGGKENPRRYVSGYVTEDQDFLIVWASQSTSGNQLYIKDLTKADSQLKEIIGDFENDHLVVRNDGAKLLIRTNLDAPNNRLVEVDFNNPSPENWKDVIPETEWVLETNTAGDKIFAFYLVDAKTKVIQFDIRGKKEREIILPGVGTAMGFGGEKTDSEVYYSFTSFTVPSNIYKYNIESGTSTLYQSPKVKFNPDDFETKQVFYTSPDGTKVPMFIVHKKGIKLNGKNPTYLYAYGGFSVNMTPYFSTHRIAWLEGGGIYAQPSIRGGNEYGEGWHKAGTKLNKQNVFDDFIAAAEYLIQQNYTSSDYLAISGGSNGGLLVGATMTQRPDLMKVALPAVGVLDMLRYHKFTAGAGWASDYGTAEDSKEMFEYLHKYSPLHALESNIAYPATLITTADHDDRVVPAHSFKFAARLQECQKSNVPVLIRVETDAGHGAGKSTSKIIEEAADKYAFTWYNMGVTPKMGAE